MLRIIYQYDAGERFRTELDVLLRQGFEVSVCPESDQQRFIKLLKNTDVIWHCLGPINSDVINAAPKLKLIQKIGVGVNTIDLELAAKHNIPVCNMPGTNSQAMAEHTLGLMLSVLRQIPRFDTDVRMDRGWNWQASRQDQLAEIRGSTIGLVGYGSIAKILAPILESMGAKLLITSRSRPETGSYPGEYVSLNKLLQHSDIVSLHTPLTPETRGLINAQSLDRMKAGSLLVNTARGALIEEHALISALNSGHLAGAGLDVFDQEPFVHESELKRHPNTVLTPHVGWLSHETLMRSLNVAVENCQRLEAGKTLLHRVV